MRVVRFRARPHVHDKPGGGTLQPGDLKDLMLHETAVAWIDRRLTVTTPAKPWDETVDEFGERLRHGAE